MIDAFSPNFKNPVADYLKRKQGQVGSALGQTTGTQTVAAPATTAAPSTPAAPFSSTSGDNVKAYLDKKSATLGQDSGAISEAGQLYADKVTNGLKTPDASSVNAQNTQDTAASRRAYLANQQSGEAIGQSGFAPGTAQADRIRMNSQAGVDEANQAGQNSVNAYVRQRTEDNMNRAQGLETQQYNRNQDTLQQAQGQDLQEYGRSEKATDRGLQAAATAYAHGRDTVGDQHWDTTNTQQQAQQGVENTHWDTTNTQNQTQQATQNQQWNTTNQQNQAQQGVDNAHWSTMNAQQQQQLGFENAQVLKGNDETAKRNLLSSLPEGPAKNAVMAGLADGSLTTATALAKVMNADGTIKDGSEGGGVNYRGQSPGQLGLNAEKEYAQQTVDLQDPNLKNTNPQEYLARVNAEMLKSRNAKNAPTDTATIAANKADITGKLNSGGTLTPDEETQAVKTGAIPTVSADHVPTGDGISAFTAQNPSGKFAIGGKVYTISDHGTERTSWYKDAWGSKNPRHTDYTEATDSAGNKKYFYDGAMHDDKPVSV